MGEGNDGTGLYGKWEDRAARTLPALDACGAHFGVTPESNGAVVYHHHISDLPPFTFGCYGPATDAQGQPALVSLQACRALYSSSNRGCGDGDQVRITTAQGTVDYDPWCPCFIGGSNVESGGNRGGDSRPPPTPPPPVPPLSSLRMASRTSASMSTTFSPGILVAN